MEIVKELQAGKAIESTIENQLKVEEAIHILFSYGNREPVIWIAINEISNRAYICLYPEPLKNLGEQGLCLRRNEEHKWLPDKTLIDIQLAKLGHDFQDSQG